MVRLFERIPNFNILQTLYIKLSCSHLIKLISIVELYLRWLQKNEMSEGEDSPIGLILYAKKSEEEIELLELDKSGIHVAEYMTQLPPKELLQEKLHKAIERAR